MHQVGGYRKLSSQSTNGDQKSVETVFLIVICSQSCDKWQSKTVSNEFYLRSSTVLAFSIAVYPVCDYAACHPGSTVCRCAIYWTLYSNFSGALSIGMSFILCTETEVVLILN